MCDWRTELSIISWLTLRWLKRGGGTLAELLLSNRGRRGIAIATAGKKNERMTGFKSTVSTVGEEEEVMKKRRSC